MPDLNSRVTPKATTHDQKMAREVFDKISNFYHPAKKCTAGKEEIKEESTHNGDDLEKIKREKERNKEQETSYFSELYTLYLIRGLLNQIYIVHPSLSFNYLSNFPIVNFLSLL